jgi:predicted aspartyl protease
MESHAFTLKANGLLRAIVTEARLSSAFDPANPPQPTPSLVAFQAIWDTGATGSVISQRVVDQCRLVPIGLTEAMTAGGIVRCEVYLVNIFLPNAVGFPNVTVTKANMGKTDVLIGMDLINKGDLALTHEHANTVFSFRYPSMTTIDFRQ